MKKLILATLIAAPLTMQPVYATGIPVVDVAGILQMVTEGLARAQEFRQQISEARNRLGQLKDDAEFYKDMVDGHFDFERILNDPTLNQYLALDDWKQIYNDVDDLANLRDEFNMHSDNPAIQKRYDSELKQYAAQERFYEMSVKRNKNLQALLRQFSSATNPAAKADLANSIQFENAQLKNDAEMMETMTTLMQQKQNYEATRAAREKMDTQRGAGMEVDYSSALNGRG